MITSAITAAIVAVLNFLGIPPGPYIAGIWIGVKVLIVASMAFFAWRIVKKRAKANLSKPADPGP